MVESKLEAARRKGDLTAVVGAMREEWNAQQSTATPAREQIDVVDGAIRVAAQLSATGTKDAERRQVLSGVQVGTTVTAQGAAKTLRSRVEKLDKTLAWAKGLTEDQREAFIVSEKFDALTDRQQELISEAFGQIEDREYEDSIGVANYDLNGELPDVDAIVGDEDEEAIDAAGLGEDDYAAIFEEAGWEAEQTP